MRTDVSVLYVDKLGIYPKLVADWWGEERDARLYAGPNPVVAHPPCQRWGRYWGGGPMLHGTPKQKQLGDDDGCFASALAAVRRWGGVLEHPEASHAFKAHGLRLPKWSEGWARDPTGWVCCVAQGNYGHRARKLTWLFYAGGQVPPELDWSIPSPRSRLDYGFHSAEERAAQKHVVAPRVNASRLSAAENLATPPAFAAWLLEIAAGARHDNR